MKKRLVIISLMILCACAAGGCTKSSNKIVTSLFKQCSKIANNFTGDSAVKSTKISDKKLSNELAQTSESKLFPTLYATRNDICAFTGDIASEAVTPTGDEAILLINTTDNKVVCAYNAFATRYPASMTKIMTCYAALKSKTRINSAVTCTEDIKNIDSASTTAGLQVGDRLYLEGLIYGTMLPSGNDAAIALAEGAYDTTENAVTTMNSYAKKFGMTGTNYVNVNGLHNNAHYTTAYDMYLIFREYIKDDTLVEVIKTANYTAECRRGENIIKLKWGNTNEYLTGNVTPPSNITSIGGKTGTTNEAGSCLTLLATTDTNKQYIAIIMNAADHASLYAKMNQLLTLCQ